MSRIKYYTVCFVLARLCLVLSPYISIFPATLNTGHGSRVGNGELRETLKSVLLGERGLLPGPESTRWIGPRKCSTRMLKENFRMTEITKWTILLKASQNLFSKFDDKWWRSNGNRGQSDHRWREWAEIMTSDFYFISINKYFMSAATNFPFRLIDIPWDTKCLYHMRFKHFQDSRIKVNHSWK